MSEFLDGVVFEKVGFALNAFFPFLHVDLFLSSDRSHLFSMSQPSGVNAGDAAPFFTACSVSSSWICSGQVVACRANLFRGIQINIKFCTAILLH